MIAEGKIMILFFAMIGAAALIRHDHAAKYRDLSTDEIIQGHRIEEKLDVVSREQDSLARHVQQLREEIYRDSCSRFKHLKQ